MKFKRSQYVPTSHFQSTELCLIIIIIIIIKIIIIIIITLLNF